MISGQLVAKFREGSNPNPAMRQRTPDAPPQSRGALRAQVVPEKRPLNRRGRRESRVPGRTRSLACEMKVAHEQVTTGPPKQSGLPCAMVYGLFWALPGVHDVLVTVARAIAERHHRELGTSQGVPEPHSFAVRVGIVRLMMPPRPPHPRLTSRDDRDTPSASEAGCTTHTLICASEKQNYFYARCLTGFLGVHSSGKSLCKLSSMSATPRIATPRRGLARSPVRAISRSDWH